MPIPLVVQSVGLCSLETTRQHHTQYYECLYQDTLTPVLRRGQPFPVLLRFSGRPYDKASDAIQLLFSFGKMASVKERTKSLLVVKGNEVRSYGGWTVALHPDPAELDNALRLQVEAAADCPVGEWKMKVKIFRNRDCSIYYYPNNVYILFNPWSKKDQVYMDTERLLDEYVLNDVGKIWMRGSGPAQGREWVFGQFDSLVLPAAMLILRRSPLTRAQHGDPVLVARAISKMVNSNDDNGILMGRWKGNADDYKDGTHPAAWTGSVPILEEYLSTGEKVRYGQCWVFAGVVNTVCRALGIPSRVVTNIGSAHDCNESLTIDIYIDVNDKLLKKNPREPKNKPDTIWNFHVWNDVWMARTDLPTGYGGWQAIDATPQERSRAEGEREAVYQCGPAPLEAIRCGAVGLSYDVCFLVSEVNADVVYWKQDPDSELGFKRVHSDKEQVGKMILTKQPFIFDPHGDSDREDITSQYKYKEGTKAERLALMNAVSCVARAREIYDFPDTQNLNVEFLLVHLDSSTVTIGKDFFITVKIHNRADAERRVRAMMSVSSVYYNGVKGHHIKREYQEVTLHPDQHEAVSLCVRAEEYLGKLVEYCHMKFSAVATVLDTNETWADEDDFELKRPQLSIQVNGDEITMDRPTTIYFSFKNPLKKHLTGCHIRYEAPRIIVPAVVKIPDIRPEGDLSFTVPFTPLNAGRCTIVGTFISRELVDITGSVAIDVLGSEG